MIKAKKFIPKFIIDILRKIRVRYDNHFFPKSEEYWESRYNLGGDSGEGSYGRLAKFKANTINSFVENQGINSVIEFGCGDGNQLSLAVYPKYIGLDVSNTAISMCKEHFKSDHTKEFYLYPLEDKDTEPFAELGLSLDVIYHLVEDDVFEKHIRDLFSSSSRFVIIYSSNFDSKQVRHEKRRKFTDKVEQLAPEWKLDNVIKNKYPEDTLVDFYIYKKLNKENK